MTDQSITKPCGVAVWPKQILNIWHTLPLKVPTWTDEANNMMKEKADYLPQSPVCLVLSQKQQGYYHEYWFSYYI